MKKLLPIMAVCIGLQGCSMMETEGLDLASTPENLTVTVVSAALGGYLGSKLGDDVANSAGKTLGLLGGTYVGMLAPSMLKKKYGSQMYTETTTVRRGGVR